MALQTELVFVLLLPLLIDRIDHTDFGIKGTYYLDGGLALMEGISP